MHVHMALNLVLIHGVFNGRLFIAVHGCRDLHTPDGANVFRTGHSAVIVCNDTFDMWHVTCGRDGHWVGDVTNCSTRTPQHAGTNEDTVD
jgi:hypothetical protein